MNILNYILTESLKFSTKLVCITRHFLPSLKIKFLVVLWFTFKTRGHNLIHKAKLLIGSKTWNYVNFWSRYGSNFGHAGGKITLNFAENAFF